MVVSLNNKGGIILKGFQQTIMHIPHSSTFIPDSIKGRFSLTEAELNEEILTITDHFTQEIFSIRGMITYIYPYSRLVCDPERFRDDKKETLSKVGQGAVYTLSTKGRPLRKTPFHRESILKEYYDPYHRKMEELVSKILKEHGSCLIIDAHSFPSKPLPYEEDRRRERPQICIGSTNFHMKGEHLLLVENLFREKGFSVEHNYPYQGSFVPQPFYLKEKRVSSIMIELNRSLYIHEGTGEKLASFTEVKEIIHTLLPVIAASIIP